MASSLHNTKCIFCYSKKPNVMVKYKWEALNEYYLGSIAGHHSPYLIDEFERKGFWRPKPDTYIGKYVIRERNIALK